MAVVVGALIYSLHVSRRAAANGSLSSQEGLGGPGASAETMIASPATKERARLDASLRSGIFGMIGFPDGVSLKRFRFIAFRDREGQMVSGVVDGDRFSVELDAGKWWASARAEGCKPVLFTTELTGALPVQRHDIEFAPLTNIFVELVTRMGMPAASAWPGIEEQLVCVAASSPFGARLLHGDGLERYPGSVFHHERSADKPAQIGYVQADGEDPMYVALVLGSHVIDQARSKNGYVRFTLDPPGLALSTISFLLTPEDESRLQLQPQLSLLRSLERIDPTQIEEGRYTYARLAPDDYLLRILSTTGLTQKRVSVAPGQASDLGMLSLAQTFQLSGVVEADLGVPVQALHVLLAGLDSEGGSCELLPQRRLDIIEADGSFELELATGWWEIQVAGRAWSRPKRIFGSQEQRQHVVLPVQEPAKLVLLAEARHIGYLCEVLDGLGCTVMARWIRQPGPLPVHAPAGRGIVRLLRYDGLIASSYPYDLTYGPQAIELD